MRTLSRPRRRRFGYRPRLEPLEARRPLAASLGATWIGQDGQDLVGGPAPGVGNGIQDIRIALGGLPASPIATLELLGYGGGRWVVNIGGYNPFNGKIVREEGAATADLYVEPYQVETGRQFHVLLTFDDGTKAEKYFPGGAADPNLRMPEWKATAAWAGQEATDLVGNGAGVGPDGIVDARIRLDRLYPTTAVVGVRVARAGATGWAAGLNPDGWNNAEFVRDPADPTRGDVYINPDANLQGQALTVTVLYADGRSDQAALAAGATNPALAAATPPAVAVSWNTFAARWLGQDGLNLTGPGDVRLGVEGLPAGRSIVAATLSNGFGTAWAYVKPGSGATSPDPYARPLGLKPSADPTRADLAFAPVRNEAGATLTLQLTLDDGSRHAVRIPGGSSDPGLRVAGPASTSVVAFPGDDLNDLAARFGTIRLVAGVYPMDRPLVLSKPVSILAAPGATLLFRQGADDPAWTAAIKVHASHTTLDGFAVRFAGPVRWREGISYGPAVVGTTDNFDPWTGDPKLNLAFTRLDLQAPPPSTAWEEPSLFRLVSAASGRVADNRLKGGMTELKGGPWLVTGNNYLGTLPGTYAYTAFAAHDSREVTVSDNRAEPTGPSGKTWRFLVMTQQGIGDAVLNNVVRGIGPMDADTVAHPNAPEIILTESYRLHYEGLTARISADGWVVQIPTLQAGLPRTGAVLAILNGPQAGQWRMIAQPINATTYLLDAPIAAGGVVAVSIATGFVNQTFLGNTVDARGSSVADPIVLAGNQFGVKVIGNRTYGGDQSFRITAYPSETPNIWGWTRAPFLGATISGNTFEDSLMGGSLGVEGNAYSKSNAGRVYFSGTLQNNTAIWTEPFLAARAARNLATPPRLVTIGTGYSIDAGESRITATGNRVSGPASVASSSTFYVVAGTINGVATRNQGTALPALGGVTSTASGGGTAGGGSIGAGLVAVAPPGEPTPTVAAQLLTPVARGADPAEAPSPAAPIAPAAGGGPVATLSVAPAFRRTTLRAFVAKGPSLPARVVGILGTPRAVAPAPLRFGFGSRLPAIGAFRR